MLQHFFLTFLRNFKRQPGYSLINILGLSIGLASAWILFLFINFEFSYDDFHPKAASTYQIFPKRMFGDTEMFFYHTPPLLGEELALTYPEVKNQVSAIEYTQSKFWPEEMPEKRAYEPEFLFVSEQFFEVFDFPAISGDPSLIFETPFSVFLTQSMALQYFGSQDPIGKVVNISFLDTAYAYIVQGILEDFPDNTDLNARYLSSYDSYFAMAGEQNKSWGSFSAKTFVVLPEKLTSGDFEAKVDTFMQEKAKEDEFLGDISHRLVSVTDLHLEPLGGGSGPNTQKRRLYIFGLIGLGLLMIAGINYINLATARAASRELEVGVKKVLGAGRNHLIYQFMGEALIFSFIAVLLALVWVDLSLPYLYNVMQKEFAPGLWGQANTWLSIAGLGTLTGLFSGIYPALILSSRGRLHKHFSGKREKINLRKFLVGFQFTAAALLIICVLVIRSQLHFMRNQNPGFNQDQVVYVKVSNRFVAPKHAVIKKAFLDLAGVISASSCNLTLDGRYGGRGIKVGMNEGETMVRWGAADSAFVQTLEMKLVAGRWPKDQKLGGAEEYVVNQTFIEDFEFDDPLNKPLSNDYPEDRIVGIISDFHLGSLREEISPFVISGMDNQNVRHIVCKLRGGNITETLSKMEEKWKETVVGEPFAYHFLEDTMEELYAEETRISFLITLFSSLAICIACLGLFALVAYAAEVRSKEIGIRKVLGASTLNILTLLNRSFFFLIGSAFIIATPLAIWLMEEWLSGFAYRIDLQPSSFLLAAGLLILFSVLTVSYYSLKAALADPVEAIRDE